VTKLTSITVALIILSGCASLTDFQKMDVSQRANYICNDHDGVESLGRDAKKYKQLAGAIQSVMTRGYRVHKSCKRVRVDRPSGDPLKDVLKTPVYHKECTETPVPIDYEGERSKYSAYLSAAQRASKQRADLFAECYQRVRSMSAEQAYEYYKQVR